MYLNLCNSHKRGCYMVTIAEIRDKLKEAIKNSGKSQTEIARLLNIKQPTIACYLADKALPSLDTLANLCILLDLDANEILCISENRKSIINV